MNLDRTGRSKRVPRCSPHQARPSRHYGQSGRRRRLRPQSLVSLKLRSSAMYSGSSISSDSGRILLRCCAVPVGLSPASSTSYPMTGPRRQSLSVGAWLNDTAVDAGGLPKRYKVRISCSTHTPVEGTSIASDSEYLKVQKVSGSPADGGRTLDFVLSVPASFDRSALAGTVLINLKDEAFPALRVPWSAFVRRSAGQGICPSPR